jgi:hypothetical protein
MLIPYVEAGLRGPVPYEWVESALLVSIVRDRPLTDDIERKTSPEEALGDATAEEKSASVQLRLRAYWDNLSPEERSTEMKRRAQVRAKNEATKKSR